MKNYNCSEGKRGEGVKMMSDEKATSRLPEEFVQGTKTG